MANKILRLTLLLLNRDEPHSQSGQVFERHHRCVGLDFSIERTQTLPYLPLVLLMTRSVVGPAGAGKSNVSASCPRLPCANRFNGPPLFATQFVDTTAGVPPPGSEHVGHGLGACTTDVRAVRVHHPRVEGREIILLDTPGFDEMGTTEDDVYQMIIDWTKKR
jgi:hypothetical protein